MFVLNPTRLILRKPTILLNYLWKKHFITTRIIYNFRPSISLYNTSIYNFPIFRQYSDYPSHSRVNLPALSPTMEKGNIASWSKKEGDKLSPGDLLAEIETDKATMGFETPEDGYLAKIVYPAGTKDIPVGKVICIIVSKKEDVAKFKDFKDEAAVAPVAAPAPAAPGVTLPSPAALTIEKTPAASGEHVYASPLARKQAEARNLVLQGSGTGLYGSITSEDLEKMGAGGGGGERVYASPLARKQAEAKNLVLHGSGTGLFGSITTEDLDKMGSAPAFPSRITMAATPVNSQYKDIPVTSMRATIAKRLLQSKTEIPHYYLSTECNMDNLVKIRGKFNKKLEKQKIRLSFNDFVIKATAMASKKVPEANSQWAGSSIRMFQDVDVSVAVSTDGGLITPIVFRANDKGVMEINQNVKELAARARSGKLQPHEFLGGTISVSNLGMYGVKSFCAVINPPQSCILAVGSTEKRVVIDTKDSRGYKESQFMIVTLSCDHRVVDGAVGAEWLQAFKQNIEDPVSMII